MRFALVFVLALALPLSAGAVDLTGTWEGKISCKGSDGSNFSFSDPVLVQITHAGTDVRVQFPAVSPDIYAGVSIDDTKKPDTKGVAYLIHCGMSEVPTTGQNGFGETAFLRATTKSNGGGSLKGSSVFFFFESPPLEVSACKWSLKRTDPAHPGVPACPL
jgi:hypothetical protein